MAPHRPDLGLLPLHALRELHAGTLRFLAQDSESEQTRPQLPGMGRYLAAIVVCADANLDLPTLLDRDADELLILSSPGPLLRSAEISLIERAVAEYQLSLCLVITHEDCATLDMVHTAEPEGWVKRLRPSAILAKQRAVSLGDAHGVLTARQLIENSIQLSKARKAGKFQVANLLIRRRGDHELPVLSWRAAWSRRPFHSARPR